jgi:TonB family protein
MHYVSGAVRAITIAGVVLVSRSSEEQNAGAPSKGEVVLLKLATPTYPPLAKQTRIAGDVEVYVEVGPSGSIDTTKVIEGHPLLAQAALDSAQQSRFECKNCLEEGLSIRLTYTFQLRPTVYCAQGVVRHAERAEDQPYPRVKLTDTHVTILDRPIGTCDLPGVIGKAKVRSLKCLYLWRCATARGSRIVTWSANRVP